MELKRKCAEKIFNWYRNSHKALLVKGARQVGKTHLIRQVLNDLKCNYVEFNLIESPDAVEVLRQSHTIDDLRMGLSTLTPEPLIKGQTVIFIDEVQKYTEMVTKIKFFVEEGSFRYILSGSLLGVELTGLESAPVGYLSILEMYPLDFEEFLQVTDIKDDVVKSLKECFIQRKPVLDIVNDRMLDMFNRYLVVGGMPEAVSRFAESHSLNEVAAVHQDIRALYKLDFTQYESNDKKLLITNAYDLIPAELLKQNRRFIITDMKKGLRFDRIENTFLWLSNAGVAIPSLNATEPRVPLRANEKQTLFKLFLSDVGMLTSEYGMATKRMLITKNPNINAGGIYENVVAQELYSRNIRLYYYNSNRLGELDFVIENDNRVTPIEVKSGKDYAIHSALNNCLNNPEYQIEEAFVLANCNISRSEKVTYLPVYMVMFIEPDNSEYVLDDLRL